MSEATENLKKAIDKINWMQCDTAYSRTGEKIAVYLKDLFSDDKPTILEAINMLYASVCHQDIAITSAALPSYDFLLYALLNLDDDIKIELLHLLKGFAWCISDDIDTIKSRWDVNIANEIIINNSRLKKKFMADLEIYKSFVSHPDKDISLLSREIFECLTNE